jgi:hypothetical protein
MVAFPPQINFRSSHHVMPHVRRIRFLFPVAILLVIASRNPAAAQGLIWKLPAQEKFTITYGGTYTQDDVPAPANAATAKKPQIRRELIVKSLGRDKGYFNGKLVDCRMLEFIISTGEIVEGEIADSGPGARRIYKALVPESAIVGGTHDRDGIVFSMLPVATDQSGKTVYGLIKIGDAPARPMKAPVLQPYPMLTLLQHYRVLKLEPSVGAEKIAGMQIAPNEYKKYSAKKVVESLSSRSTNTAEIIQTDRVPTGRGGWKVTLVREEKNAAQSRNEFKKVTTITTNMVCRKIEMDANSELKKLK